MPDLRGLRTDNVETWYWKNEVNEAPSKTKVNNGFEEPIYNDVKLQNSKEGSKLGVQMQACNEQ